MGAESSVAAQLCVRGSMLMVLVRCGVMCDEPMPLSGVPCFPFYRAREGTCYKMGEDRRREAEEVLQGHRPFLFLRTGPADTVGGDRDNSTPGACPLTMPCPSIVSGSSRPTPLWWAARRTNVLISGRTGSRQHSDHASVTVGDVSSLE